MVWEGKHGPARVETDTGVPAGEVGRRLIGQIPADGLVVEVPLVAVVSLDHIVEENVSPLGADDCIPEFVGDDGVGSVYVEVVEQIEATCDFLEGLVVELVHRAGIDPEIACYMLEVVAGRC